MSAAAKSILIKRALRGSLPDPSAPGLRATPTKTVAPKTYVNGYNPIINSWHLPRNSVNPRQLCCLPQAYILTSHVPLHYIPIGGSGTLSFKTSVIIMSKGLGKARISPGMMPLLAPPGGIAYPHLWEQTWHVQSCDGSR